MLMNDMIVLIMSCDLYEDCYKPFSILYNKYFPNNYKTYIVTETKDCEYFDTIKKTGAWTKRLREALCELDSDYVLLMLDDYFIHNQVDNSKIEECLKIIKETNAIVYNFEIKYRKCMDMPFSFDVQLNKQVYLNSTQPSIWNRQRLIERLDKDQTPQEWELTKIDSQYMHLINNTNEKIINTGYDLSHKPWGIVKGKWSRETKELFDKEGIEIDYEKRGYFN